jgi:hypothetical protein
MMNQIADDWKSSWDAEREVAAEHKNKIGANLSKQSRTIHELQAELEQKYQAPAAYRMIADAREFMM